MKRKNVNSSNLRSIGYESSTRTLEIEFNHSGVYQYYNVPQDIYDGLINASSHGQYFDINIKKAGYRYLQV